jgi:uncharacterized membrane protein YoaK (UPF0700 family)
MDKERSTVDSSRPSPSSSKLRSFYASLCKDVADDIVIETQMMVLALAAGINDATTFSDYHVFVSNQTGNTALLAVGALGIGDGTVELSNIGFSLGLFVVGGLVFGQAGDFLGRRRKIWLITTNVLQTAVMFAAAALRHWLPDTREGGPAWAVISLLALSSGGQVAMARTINLPQIPTAMVTSAYVDFLVDPDILKLHNRPRNRRLFFVVSLLVGSFIGAVAYRYVEPSLSLFLAACCKTIVSVSFFFNPELDEGEVDEAVESTVDENDPTR